MGKTPRKHSPSFKVKVVLEIIRGHEPLTVTCSKYCIHPTQARRWKDEVIAGMETMFGKGNKKELEEKDELIEQLYKQIGQLIVERDWLKKKYNQLN